ncbi:type VI secretion system baseplate subunit TssG [Pseudoduganella sp.]|uniref:type VI secretion system baseplate subunit TssG n=1 Tax=Pseudoduganella sp. TaxID=1880898 RepID=UPI0035B271F0
MQAPQRLSDLSVIQELLEAPERFQFVQAMRILQAWLAQNGIAPERILTDVLRFENSLSLSFPASEMAAMCSSPVVHTTEAELLQALQRDDSTRINLTPHFFGLLGTSGALPLHVTERIAEARDRHGNAAAHAFINILSQRMVTLFYQAWAKNRLEHTLDVTGRDSQLSLLMSLAGAPADRLSWHPAAAAHVIGYYAAMLGTSPVAAGTVSRVLENHFGVPIELEPFVAAWDEIPQKQRSRLGSGIASLGYGAALGRRIRRRDRTIRLNIGPLTPGDVERFLPRRPAALALSDMVALFDLSNLKISVRLLLQPSCIQRAVLSSKPGTARRIGWDAFLVGPRGKVSRASIEYLMPPPARSDAAA